MSLFLFLLCRGLAAASACGSSWTFLFTTVDQYIYIYIYKPLLFEYLNLYDLFSIIMTQNCNVTRDVISLYIIAFLKQCFAPI